MSFNCRCRRLLWRVETPNWFCTAKMWNCNGNLQGFNVFLIKQSSIRFAGMCRISSKISTHNFRLSDIYAHERVKQRSKPHLRKKALKLSIGIQVWKRRFIFCKNLLNMMWLFMRKKPPQTSNFQNCRSVFERLTVKSEEKTTKDDKYFMTEKWRHLWPAAAIY